MAFSTIFIIIVILLLIWLFALSFVVLRAYRVYKKLTAGIDKKDFSHSLVQIKEHLKQLDKDIDDFRALQRDTNQTIKNHLQKVGFIRFNPFGNTGGDQSFCLCLLNQHDDGILISSLHARDQTRIYTKQIKKGKPEDKNSLSKEESKCLAEAIKGGN